MFSSCNPKLCAVRHSHYPGNSSSGADAVFPSSNHCCTETVLPSSDDYCSETVSPSGDHCVRR